MRIMLLFLFTAVSLNSFGQNIRIQEIQITDTLLKNEVISFINSAESSSENFKQYGYVEVSLLYINNEAINQDLKLKYRIKDQYYALHKKSNFPLYYTYLEDKIVLIFNLIPLDFKPTILSVKGKKKMMKMINSTLKQPEHIVAKDSVGNIIINDKNFIDDSYNIHGGEILYIYIQ